MKSWYASSTKDLPRILCQTGVRIVSVTWASYLYVFGVGERRGSGPLSRPHAGGVTAISPGSRRTRRAPGVSEPARSAVERSAAVRDSTSPRPQRPTHQLVTARKGSYRDRTRVASCSTRIDTQRLRSRLPAYETRHRSLDRRLTTYTNPGCAASTPRSGANGCDASSVEDFFRGRDCEGRGHGAAVLRNTRTGNGTSKADCLKSNWRMDVAHRIRY